MSKQHKRVNFFLENDEIFKREVYRSLKARTSQRIYGHSLSEIFHYLEKAKVYRREGRYDVASSYVKGARSIRLDGTNWTNTPFHRAKLP